MSSQTNFRNETHEQQPATQPSTLGERYTFVKALPTIAKSIYPETSSARQLKKAAVFSFNGIRYQSELLNLQSLFDCPELEQVLTLCPAILEKPFSPYVCANWDLAERMNQLAQHFTYLKNTFGKNTELFYRQTSYPLFEFQTAENDAYSVEIFPGYQSEGSIGLRLVDSDNAEIYTTSIHIAGSDKFGETGVSAKLGEPSITIGALQGPNDTISDRQKKIITLTKTLHGLRPKALMIEAVYMLASALEIKTIRGINNSSHIYQSAKFNGTKLDSVQFDFDELWQEFQGEAESAHFYRLPTSPVRKVIEELKSKKRSMYRKRYAWLDDVHNETVCKVRDVMINPHVDGTDGCFEKAA